MPRFTEMNGTRLIVSHSPPFIADLERDGLITIQRAIKYRRILVDKWMAESVSLVREQRCPQKQIGNLEPIEATRYVTH